jgi:hypothetical protein
MLSFKHAHLDCLYCMGGEDGTTVEPGPVRVDERRVDGGGEIVVQLKTK